MITLQNKKLEDKLKNILKSIEVLGGKELINNYINSEEDLVTLIVTKSLNGEEIKLNINNNQHTLFSVEKEKIDYEKYILKNKNRIINYIVHSILEYNKQLASLIKKYSLERDKELYKEIESKILKTYREDINRLILAKCNIDYSLNYEDNKYYGKYLTLKREEILQSIINKIK